MASYAVAIVSIVCEAGFMDRAISIRSPIGGGTERLIPATLRVRRHTSKTLVRLVTALPLGSGSPEPQDRFGRAPAHPPLCYSVPIRTWFPLMIGMRIPKFQSLLATAV